MIDSVLWPAVHGRDPEQVTRPKSARELGKPWLRQRHEPEKLTIPAMGEDLDYKIAEYKRTIEFLNAANKFIGDANKKIANGSKAIEMVDK